MFLTKYESPIGMLTLTAEGDALTGLWIEGQKYFMAGIRERSDCRAFCGGLDKACRWLDRYFSGERPVPSELDLRPSGTAFQRMVWERLCRIPWGETVSYGTIAREIAGQTGRKASAQAVGGAVGHNPISIIIPCHRVVGAGGSLTGYAGGLDRKVWLLEREGTDISRLIRPRRGTAL